MLYLLYPNSSTTSYSSLNHLCFIAPGTSHEYAGCYSEDNLSVPSPSKGRWGVDSANGTSQYGDLEQSVSHP